MKKIYGTGVALVTPFKEGKNLDFKSLEKLVSYVSKNGIQYLVILGTTGESSTLEREEKNDIISCIKDSNKKKFPLVLGLGGNNTKKVIKEIKKIKKKDFEAILSVSPYYNRPSQKGIYKHFKKIAENTECDIVIYNIPSRTGSNIKPNTIIKLANNFKNIIGVKESSGNILQSYKIIKNKPEKFFVLSGDDIISLPIIIGGGDGVISVFAQAIPREFYNMIKLAIKGNIRESFYRYYKMMDIIEILFEEGNPTGIKSLLSYIGICKSYVRLPLVKATNNFKKKLWFKYKIYSK
jgi:4-hydroxy-tetrahydrodipicolinate synthase